jgi:hypothetical protein
MATLTVGLGTHMALAARGSSVAIAWDQMAGSYGVLAAVASGTSWTRLGRALDVDIEGNAVSPAIALDASGAAYITGATLQVDGGLIKGVL